jgi:hypothetical protein
MLVHCRTQDAEKIAFSLAKPASSSATTASTSASATTSDADNKRKLADVFRVDDDDDNSSAHTTTAPLAADADAAANTDSGAKRAKTDGNRSNVAGVLCAPIVVIGVTCAHIRDGRRNRS